MLNSSIFFLRHHFYLGCLFDNIGERCLPTAPLFCFEPSLSLADFSPIMRASIACWASAQREGAYHWSGSTSGALPYAVKKSIFHIHRRLAFEIIDMHCLIPKYVSGATFSLIVPLIRHCSIMWEGRETEALASRQHINLHFSFTPAKA